MKMRLGGYEQLSATDFFSATQILVFSLAKLFKNPLKEQTQFTVCFQAFPDCSTGV